MAGETLQDVLLGGSRDLLDAAVSGYRDKNSAEVSNRIVDAQLKQYMLLNSVEQQYATNRVPRDPRQQPAAQAQFMVPEAVLWAGGLLLLGGLGIVVYKAVK